MEDWRPAIAGVFDRAAGSYDAVGVDFFSTVGTRLVARAALAPGQQVLDVGCGRGAATFPAAEAVGDRGTVHAIDLAPTMVALTTAAAEQRGIAQVRAEVMDAQEPDLPVATYDAVLSSLVVFFLPDPLAGLRAWRRATRDGGRLAITTFADHDDERWAWVQEVLPTRDPRSSTAVDADRQEDGPFESAENLHRLLAAAGFADARSEEQEHVVHFADPDQWLRWSWSHGMRMFWERVPEERRDDARREALGHLERMRETHGDLELAMTVRYTTATAA
jgi:ubiquinone/menaquinone biosynthesis C-methylase UbiE